MAVTALWSLQALNKTFNLKDAFRNKHPSDRLFTWSSADSTVSCRLDRFNVFEDIFGNTSLCGINFFPFSDHNAVSFDFLPEGVQERGPGVWKMNTDILDNREYAKKLIYLDTPAEP